MLISPLFPGKSSSDVFVFVDSYARSNGWDKARLVFCTAQCVAEAHEAGYRALRVETVDGMRGGYFRIAGMNGRTVANLIIRELAPDFSRGS
jgi:hypothetical protein